MNTTNKEIDIFELYRRSVNFIKRRWLLLFVFGSIGSIYGFVSYKFDTNKYSGSIFVSSELIPKDELFKKVFPLVKEKGGLNISSFKSLLNSEADLFYGMSDFSIDTLSFENTIVLDIEHSDSTKLQEISNVLSLFYDSQDDFNSRLDSEIASAEKYLGLIEDEIRDINEYQNQVLNKAGGKEIVFVSLSGSSKEIIDLYNSKLQVEKTIKIKKAVSVSSADIYQIRRESFVKSTVLWGLLLLFLGFVLALILELDLESKKRL